MIDPASRQVRSERLEAVLRELERRFGPWIVYRLRDGPLQERAVSAIPSGSLALDFALGIGGYPRGRIVEIVGPSGSGKSILAFHLLANAQRQRGFAVYVDAGHRADYEQMARCGISLADLFLVVPESAAEALEVASLLVESHGLDALAFGPLAELVGPRADLARDTARRLARLNAVLAGAPTSVLFLSADPPTGARRPWPSLAPLSRALRHFASVRLQTAPVAPVRHASGDILGWRVEVTTIKNKLAPAQRRAVLELRRDRGIHPAADLLDLGLARGIVVETLAGLCLDTHFLGRGRAGALSSLESDPTLANTLREQVISLEGTR
ncbi:MAG TPA: ATPase domain-containing protein [Chloroflexota bacterium]|nr:ATPase domain-containing protein [Chloroflexota bacterium]